MSEEANKFGFVAGDIVEIIGCPVALTTRREYIGRQGVINSVSTRSVFIKAIPGEEEIDLWFQNKDVRLLDEAILEIEGNIVDLF